MDLGTSLPEDALMAKTTAKILLEIEAAYFNVEKPFIFTSGWASPVYIDCRKLISFPRARRTIIEFSVAKILRGAGFESLDAVVGGETAGIPFAAWIADRLQLPMLYVRKQPKGFGRLAQIEGDLHEGLRLILVEDLTTDAKSKVNFCKALRTAGGHVKHAFVVFHYGIFPQSLETMKEIGVNLHALATWWDVIEVAEEEGYFAPHTLKEVRRFMGDPVTWSREHGGLAEFSS